MTVSALGIFTVVFRQISCIQISIAICSYSSDSYPNFIMFFLVKFYYFFLISFI